MVSEKFRHQLRQEVKQWHAEGLIDSSVYEQLDQRYQLNELDNAAKNRFVMILLGLGGILLGLAIVTLVAANWQVWSRSLRVILLLSLFIGINTAGFYLWRYPRNTAKARLGKTFLLLGSLTLGANLGLMSQMFHVSGAVYHLYLVWGLGVLAMAYSLRLTMLGVVAFILIAIGYSLGIPSLYRPGQISIFQLMVQHMPLLGSGLLIPLAYWCRSRWLFALSAILITISLEVNLTRQLLEFLDRSTFVAGWIGAIACTVPPGLLWAYRDNRWRLPAQFSPIAQNLAITFLGFIFYLFSFNFFWTNSPTPVIMAMDWFSLLIILDALVLGGIAIASWVYLGYSSRYQGKWKLNGNSLGVAAMILVTGGIVGWHLSVEPLRGTATLIFNLLLFLLAVGILRQALVLGTRQGFWGGISLLVLQLLTRMLEYNTGLVFKSIVLFLCGIIIMIAGLWFERHLKALKPSSTAS